MTAIEEIRTLEEGLRLAELGPDPKFFEAVLADEVLLNGERSKAKVVAAHQPGKGSKFLKVEMSEFEFIDHGNAVVVTGNATYEGSLWSGTLRFMRVWLKKDDRWQIIAGTVSNP